MTRDEIRGVIAGAIARIAPETTAASIPAGANLREELDLDSMDFLNLMIAIHERLGVSIPEGDYARLATLDAAVDYVAARLGPAGPPAAPVPPGPDRR
jgi:acyl carrier protein